MMRRTILSALLVPLLGVLALLALSLRSPEAGSAATVDEGPLAEAMEAIEDELRALREGMKKGAEGTPDCLRAVAALQVAAGEAKVAVPPMAEEKEGAERADFLREFRRSLIGMQRKLLDLEERLLDGKLEEAQALYKEVRRMEDSGHERFAGDH